MDGWIKAHRAMLSHPLLQRDDAMALWVRLLLQAATQRTRVNFRGNLLTLERGQLACSTREMARLRAVSHKRMRLIIDSFVSDGMLKMGTPKGTRLSLITICNFDRYQLQPNEIGTPKGTTGAQQGHIEQEGENLESYTEGESNSVPSSLIASPAKPARKKRLHPETPGFAVFWQAYPRKVGKLAAEKSFASAVKSGVVVAEIVAGVERYIASKPSHQDYCHPATWLTQGRWADEENVGQGQGQVVLNLNGSAPQRRDDPETFRERLHRKMMEKIEYDRTH